MIYSYFITILFFILLLASFFVLPERKIVGWFFGAVGTLINGLICLHEGLESRSKSSSRYDFRISRHYIIIALLSFACFTIFVVLYYLFGFYPNPHLNIDSPDLTSLHYINKFVFSVLFFK